MYVDQEELILMGKKKEHSTNTNLQTSPTPSTYTVKFEMNRKISSTCCESVEKHLLDLHMTLTRQVFGAATNFTLGTTNISK